MSRRISKIAGGVFAVSLALCVITGVIRLMAGDGKGMADGMLRFAPPSVTGLPAEAYGGIGDMLTGYLTGRVGEFQYELSGLLFQPHEAAHMADVRGLISLDTTVCLIAAAVCSLAVLFAVILRADRRVFCRGGLWGLGGLLLILAGFGIWAVMDFEGLFITFHKMAFTNDLWLLDPDTDMLLRLMPMDLFVHLGLKGLLWVAAGLILLTAGLWAGLRIQNESDTQA